MHLKLFQRQLDCDLSSSKVVDCALWRASGTWSLPEESSVICPVLGYLDLLSISLVVKGRDGSVVLWLSGCLA